MGVASLQQAVVVTATQPIVSEIIHIYISTAPRRGGYLAIKGGRGIVRGGVGGGGGGGWWGGLRGLGTGKGNTPKMSAV